MLDKRARVVLDTLLPSGAHPDLKLGALSAGFEDFLPHFERTAAFPMRLGFRAALFASVWIAPLLILRLPPFDRLKKKDREKALEALGKSRIYVLRQLLLLLKSIVCFSYAVHPEVRKALGLPPAKVPLS